MLVMRVLIGRPGNLAICGEGVSILDLHGPLASERVCVQVPVPLVLLRMEGE